MDLYVNSGKHEEISLVSACDAVVCKYNENKHCTAGQVTLVVEDGLPACGTFDPEVEND